MASTKSTLASPGGRNRHTTTAGQKGEGGGRKGVGEVLETSGLQKCLDALPKSRKRRKIQSRLERAYETEKSDVRNKRRAVSKSGRKTILVALGCQTMKEHRTERKRSDAVDSLLEQLYVISGEVLEQLQEGPLRQKYQAMRAKSYSQVQEDQARARDTDLLIARTELLLQGGAASPRRVPPSPTPSASSSLPKKI